jgi:hypothetical protein
VLTGAEQREGAELDARHARYGSGPGSLVTAPPTLRRMREREPADITGGARSHCSSVRRTRARRTASWTMPAATTPNLVCSCWLSSRSLGKCLVRGHPAAAHQDADGLIDHRPAVFTPVDHADKDTTRIGETDPLLVGPARTGYETGKPGGLGSGARPVRHECLPDLPRNSS